jgi:hypothetical protein
MQTTKNAPVPRPLIIPFREAIERFPERGLLIYNRVSTAPQACRDRLKAKTRKVLAAVVAAAPGGVSRVRCLWYGVESGKMSAPRPILEGAVYLCLENRWLLVAGDTSRLVRAEGFDPKLPKEQQTRPTAADYAELWRRTLGLPLATVADPAATHGEVGRPPSIDPETAAAIFTDLLWYDGLRWGRPVADVAESYGVSKQAVLRLADRPSPTGRTWREEAFAKAERLGLPVVPPEYEAAQAG